MSHLPKKEKTGGMDKRKGLIKEKVAISVSRVVPHLKVIRPISGIKLNGNF